jgi:hypothetical protein
MLLHIESLTSRGQDGNACARAFQALCGRTARGFEVSRQFSYSGDGFLLRTRLSKEGTCIDT